MLPLQARVDVGIMAMKEYSAFYKAPVYLEDRHHSVLWHIQDTRLGGGSNPAAGKRLVYSTDPAGSADQSKSIKNK